MYWLTRRRSGGVESSRVGGGQQAVGVTKLRCGALGAGLVFGLNRIGSVCFR